MTAEQYLASLPAAEQQKVQESLAASGSSLDQWYQAAIDAGDPRAVKAAGGTEAEETEGGIADWANAAPSSEWLGKRVPTPRELRRYAKEQNWSEDFARYSDRVLADWLARGEWDINAGTFKGGVQKPTETGGVMDPALSGGGGGYGGGGGPYHGGPGTYSGPGYMKNSGGFQTNVPTFNWEKFVAPSFEDVVNDPGYQFRSEEARKALQQSQAAQGLTRTGGSLKDLIGLSQDMASNEYQNAYNRALQGWGANYQGAKDAFAPLYGAWQTQYAGDLSKWTTKYGGELQKYLQKEQNIYGLLNPSWPG